MNKLIDTNKHIYEYDKHDIIDFLETEYITDWLETIPINVWIDNKKTIEGKIINLKDKKIISFVISKIGVSLPKIIVNGFEKINLELLKFCVENNFNALKKEIKKNSYYYSQIIKECIIKHDLEFNKYFYETVYFELEPEHRNINKNSIHKDNMFYNCIKKIFSGLKSGAYFFEGTNGYEVLKYYNSEFPDLLSTLEKKKSYDIFQDIFIGSKIDNFNDMMNLKNILKISDLEFKKNLLFPSSTFYFDKYIIPNVCKGGNITFIFQVLNLCDDNILLKKENVITLMTWISLSNKTENVFLAYNYLVFGKNYKFTNQDYSEIIQKIIKFGDQKHFNYKDIIIEFINLGGIVKGYSVYTDYIDSLKIKN